VYILFLLCALQEGIGLPGGGVRGEQQIGQGEGVVKAGSRCSQGSARVGVLDLDHPGRPHRLDSEPTRPACFPVVVPDNGAVSNQAPEFGKHVRLDSRQVYRGPLGRLMSRLNPFHGELRRGEDKKPVSGVSPPATHCPKVNPPVRDEADDQ